MKKTIIAIALSLMFLAPLAQAQNATNSTLMGALSSILNPEDPNSLMNASELNVTTAFIHQSDNNLNGGEFRLDWWIGKQAGMMFAYDEFGDRTAQWKLGGQVRTVFKQAELSISTGTLQNVDDGFGQVSLFVEPMLAFRVVNTPNWDVRVSAGVDFVAGQSKPNPIVGITFRFLKL